MVKMGNHWSWHSPPRASSKPEGHPEPVAPTETKEIKMSMSMQIDVKTHGSMQWKEWILQQSDYAIQHTNVRAVLRAPNIHVCGWIICRQRSAIESRMKTCNKNSKSTCNALTLHSGDTMPQCNVNGLEIRASHFFREGQPRNQIEIQKVHGCHS